MAELRTQASSPQERRKALDALKAVFVQLRTRPLDWGDPEYRTRKKGGRVYHGIEAPLVVRYAVFEPDKLVWLLSVRLLPKSPLAK
jgi:hypothetical protein